MATTGKIFSDSSNIYQDQARLLFNFYEQAAERIVRQEEALEKQIKELEEDREQVELKKSDIWKWFLTIVAFFMYWVRKNDYDRQIEAINEKIAEPCCHSLDAYYKQYGKPTGTIFSETHHLISTHFFRMYNKWSSASKMK